VRKVSYLYHEGFLTVKENLQDILIIEKKESGQNCLINFMILLSFPLILFLFFLLGYMKILSFEIDLFTLGLLFALSLFFALAAKQNSFYKQCDMESKIALLKAKTEEYMEKNLLTLTEETKTFGSIEPLISSFLRQNISSENKIPLFIFLFSFALFLIDISFKTETKNISFIIKTSLYIPLFSTLTAMWWLFFDNRQKSCIKNRVLDLQKRYTENFWSQSEIEKLKIIQNKLLIKEIQSSFEKAFTPHFIKDFEYRIKSKIELFFETLKSEKELQNLMLESYSDLLQKYGQFNKSQLEILQYLKYSKENIDNSYEKIENIISSLDEAVNKLSKETQMLNVISLNTFEHVSNSIANFDQSYENIANNTSKIYSTLELSSENIKQRNTLIEEQNRIFIKAIESLNINIDMLNTAIKNLKQNFESEPLS